MRFVTLQFVVIMNQPAPLESRFFPDRSSLHRIPRLLMMMATLCLAACIYHAPIQQGNLLDAKDIDQVKVGMTQAQVRYVLGTPMVSDPFSNNRWDYVYYLKLHTMKQSKKQQLVVYFENGNVNKLERTEPIYYTPQVNTNKDNSTRKPWYRRWFSWFA